MGASEDITLEKLIFIFGREVIDLEEEVSRSFSDLCTLCHFARPAAAEIHFCVRRIMVDAGQISLMLFPKSKANTPQTLRGEHLRAAFRVKSPSLLEQRILRNHLAHLDERLDRWAASSKNRTFGRGMLGTRKDAESLKIKSEDILGIFDPRCFAYSFWDDDIYIDELVGEIRAISHVARSALRDSPW